MNRACSREKVGRRVEARMRCAWCAVPCCVPQAAPPVGIRRCHQGHANYANMHLATNRPHRALKGWQGGQGGPMMAHDGSPGE
jgi:hypothetical protein